LYFTGTPSSGAYIRFQFSTPQLITEARWIQELTSTHSTMKWQGSNDAVSWTDIGSSFAVGGATTQIQTELSGNTTAYTYYQLLWVSGAMSQATEIYEVEFGTGSGSLGDDASGNSNNFTISGITVSDQMTDSPTNNFCTWDSVNSPVGTLSEGNLKVVGTSHDKLAVGTFPMSSGKWYWEVQVVANGARNFLGVVKLETTSHGSYEGATTDDYAGVYGHDGATYQRGGTENAEFGSSFSAGDIITICFDADNGSFWLNKNAYPDTSATALVTSLPSGLYNPMYSEASGAARATNILNAGQDGTFAGTKTAQGNADDNGYGNFEYDVPTGYYAICTKNLAEFGG